MTKFTKYPLKESLATKLETSQNVSSQNMVNPQKYVWTLFHKFHSSSKQETGGLSLLLKFLHEKAISCLPENGAASIEAVEAAVRLFSSS